MKSLSNWFVIFKRETAAYFNSPTAYIFIIVFSLLNGGLFMTNFFVVSLADMRPFFSSVPMMLAILLPAISMRLWAEEKKGNTQELLLTFPMATHELVIGKFLASLVFFLAALASSLIIPVMIRMLGQPDTGSVIGGYLGALCIGAFFLAIGIFISGLCRDQIVAFILGLLVCFGFYLLGTEFLAGSIDAWLPGVGSFLRNYVGALRHYVSFSRGVVDNRDVVYFVLGTIIFLVLNGFWLEGRMRPRAKTIFSTAVGISAGIFLMGNWLVSELPLGRFDLSEGKIYTISPATKSILRNLQAPVTAKFYISPAEKMPTGLKTLEQEVQDKLDEYRIASGGNFQYKIFHMEAANVAAGGDESLDRQLSEKGIRPFQVQSVESDEVGVKLIYSAVSIAYKEKTEQIIPRVTPDNLQELEYLLSSRIYRMTLDEVPEIALMAPYQEKSVDQKLRDLLPELGGEVPEAYREDQYELLPLALNYAGYKSDRIKLSEKEPIPDKAKTLVVAEPQNLNDRQRYEINRFLVNGGSVFLAVQNYEYDYRTAGRELEVSGKELNPRINELLGEWGFSVNQKILVDQQSDVVSLTGSRIGPFEVSVPVKLPFHVIIPQSGMNLNVSITSRLSTLFYLWGTSLSIDQKKIEPQGLQVTPLFNSSRESWNVPYKSGTLSPQDLMPKADSERGPFPLAVLVKGQFKNLYEGKTVPAWPKPETAAAEEKALEAVPSEIKPAPGKLILVGASSFLRKQMLRNGGHLNLFLNSVDALTLGDELVTIRSKQPIDRSLGRVSSFSKVFWRFLITLGLPIAIAVIGTARIFFRRQSKKNYVNALALATA